MIFQADIEKVAREIGESAHDERVVLFGSRTPVSFVSQVLKEGKTVYVR